MARLRTNFIFGVTAVLFTYLISIGGTFSGMLIPDVREFSIFLVAVTIGGWLVLRMARGWLWRATPLDAALLLWIVAFAVSLAANPESWRRIIIGLWFAFAYIGVWFLLNDLLVNRALTRDHLTDALLIAGLVVLIVGFYQVRGWLAVRLALVISGEMAFELPRPVGTLSNANTLACFLMMLVPFALGRVVTARGRRRAAMIAYTLAALLLLFLTFSRGAWVALAAAVVVQAALLRSTRGLRGPAQWRAWWSRRSLRTRWGLVGAGVLALVAVMVTAFIVALSLGQSGRSLSLRTSIYGAAWTLFTEKPLTGSGLFTFGAGLARMQSMPPQSPHSHAHDVPLLVASELGLIGLAALTLTVVSAYAAFRRNWTSAAPSEALPLASAAAAVVAFALHQLVDVPAMSPAIALTAIIALALAIAPLTAPVRSPRWRARLQGGALIAGWLALLAGGFWSSVQYARYNDAVWYGTTSGDYTGAAARLVPLVDADPALAVNYLERGYFYGLAADTGDADALNHAVSDYQRFTAIEPSYAFGWANLGALEWQSGQKDSALRSLAQAVDLAPGAWPLAYLLGQYHEQSQDAAQALVAYRQALAAQPDVLLLPGWNDSPLRAAASADVQPHDLGRLLQMIDAGAMDEARDLWAAHRSWAGQPTPTEAFIFQVIFAIDAGKLDAADAALREAVDVAEVRSDQAWISVGRARLAYARGDIEGAEQGLADARAALTLGPNDVDYDQGVNILYVQYIRSAAQRLFLPQVHYLPSFPSAFYLVDLTARLVEP